MALELRVDRAAVLVVELQNDMVHESRIGGRGLGAALAEAVRRRGLLPRVAALLAAARASGVPVIYLNVENKPGFPRPPAAIFRIAERHGPVLVEGTWGAEIHPTVRAEPRDLVLRRTCSVDASHGCGLYAVLRHLRRDQLVLAGVSTALAIEGIVRASLNRGFECFVVEDGCAAVPQEWHDWSITHTLPLLSTIVDAEAVRAALGARSAP